MNAFYFPLEGRVDVSAAGPLQARLEQDLDTLPEAPRHVILDLEKVTFLSSAGLRVLLIVHRRCAAQGGTLVLTGVGRYAHEVLQVAGLDDVFPRYASEAEARTALGE